MITGRILTTDGVYDLVFDASEWFEQASEDDILQLKWRDDFHVAIYMSHLYTSIQNLFNHVNFSPRLYRDPGIIECYLNYEEYLSERSNTERVEGNSSEHTCHATDGCRA